MLLMLANLWMNQRQLYLLAHQHQQQLHKLFQQPLKTLFPFYNRPRHRRHR
jgi:hypothetical protein